MKKLIFIATLLFLAGCGPEGNAKNVAEDYMDSVKNGEEFEAMDAAEGFIDVFDYEYLKTEKAEDNVYTFLYNVEIANGIGQKLYKKVEITVERDSYLNSDTDAYIDGYVISDIYIR